MQQNNKCRDGKASLCGRVFSVSFSAFDQELMKI